MNYTKVIEAATAYADKGYAVFPISYGKKNPATEHGFHDATTNPKVIRQHFGNGKFNVGIATGEKSDLVVIDVDTYKGGDIAPLETLYGPLPMTMEARTRAGGRHLFYKYPTGRMIGSYNNKIAPGIDVKANGGYIVAAPSYVEKDDKGPAGYYEFTNDLSLADLPAEWIDALEDLGNKRESHKTQTSKATVDLASSTLLEGPGNIDVVKGMLATIPSAQSEGCDRSKYLRVIWAIGSLNWECGEQLAREWCLKSPDDFNESDFERDWNSYEPNRSDGIGIGTLFHYAEKFGYVATDAIKTTVDDAQSAIEEWPAPTPLPPKYPETPRLDPAILPESIGAYVADSANRLQVPPEMVATPLLIGLGSVIGKKLAVQPKTNDDSWTEYPNLWGATIAPPAMLKSPAMSAGLRFIQELEDAAMRQHSLNMANWDSDKRLRELEADTNRSEAKKAIKVGDTEKARAYLDKNAEVAPPARKRHIVNDTTPEALHEIFLENSNGVMCVVDELDGYMRKLERDGYESARAQDLQQFDGKQDAASDRIKRGSSVAEGPRKAMYGNLQPTKIERYLREMEHNNDGYVQRLLQLGIQPTFDREYKLVDAEPDRGAEEQCRAIFAAVDALPLLRSELTGRIQPRIVSFTESAQEQFNKFFGGLENMVRSGRGNSTLASHIGKYRGTLPKLALILAVAENPSVTRIGLATFKQAESLLMFYLAHAKRIYAACASGEVVAAHDLLAKIKAGKVPDNFNPRDDVMRRSWSGLTTQEQVEGAIALLKKHGYVREVTTETTGRPRRSLIVHPSILSKPE